MTMMSGIRRYIEGMMPVDQVKEIAVYIRQHRKSGEVFDIVHGGSTSGKDRVRDAENVASYAAVGATWWLENIVPERWGVWGNWPLAEMHQRILDGPPRA